MDFPTRCLDSEQTTACQGKRQTRSLVFRCISFITTVEALVLSDSPQNTLFSTFSPSPTTPFEVWLWLNSRFNTDSNLSMRNFSQNYSECVEQKLFSRLCVGGWLRSLKSNLLLCDSVYWGWCHIRHVSFQMLQIKAGELFPQYPSRSAPGYSGCLISKTTRTIKKLWICHNVHKARAQKQNMSVLI